MIRDYLQDHGFVCQSVGSAEEALKRLEKEEFSLLVTDLSMPGLSGLDLLNYVANHCPDMAVIVITAVYEMGAAVDPMKMRAYDYIMKPFELDKALQTVRKVLRQREKKLRFA
jgi:DNA-binding NtrC family response regulator